MKTSILAVALLASLSACSLIPANISHLEETVAQTAVQSSERTICRNIPVGTWLRLYANNQERLNGWQLLCNNQVGAP